MNAEILNLLQQQFANKPGLQNNPQLAAMMQTLIEKQQATSAPKESLHNAPEKYLQLQRSRARWKKRAEELAHNVRFFASLFGACSVCFGEDADCPHCHGQGHIGSLTADVEQLVTLIQPVLKQAGLTIHQVASQDTAQPFHAEQSARVHNTGEPNHA